MITNSEIRRAVAKVFERYGEKTRIPMSGLGALALGILQVKPEDYKQTNERIQNYLRRSNKNGGKYKILSGKNGGVGIRAHFPDMKPIGAFYTVAVVLKVPAGSYVEAIQKARATIFNAGLTSPDGIDGRGINGKVVIDYESDNYGNRVLYLGNEYGVVQECPDEE